MIRIPVRVLHFVLSEADKRRIEREQLLNRARAGKKLPGMVAIPPFIE